MRKNDPFHPGIEPLDDDLGVEIGGLELEMDDDEASIEPGF
jgi:hypothetical protein